jgi:D-alanine-D-alanine ligase
VAVLMGGASHEREISLQSGATVFAHVDRRRYMRRAVCLLRAAQAKLLPVNATPTAAAWERTPARPLLEVFAALSAWRVDVAIPVLHGVGGEDGVLQGFLEMLGIAHTHSSVCGSAVTMDKELSKRLYVSHGIATPAYAIIKRNHAVTNQLRAVRLGWPVVAKPPRLGSSVEVHIVHDRARLTACVRRLLRLDTRVLVEQYIHGRELTCAVLQRRPDADPAALPVTEIVPVNSPFFDFKAKYTAGASREITPARVPAAVARRVQAAAVACHQALQCGGVSRTDFMLDARGRLYALETNAIPGMTPLSLLPQAAAAVGISFSALLDILIDHAVRAGQRSDAAGR